MTSAAANARRASTARTVLRCQRWVPCRACSAALSRCSRLSSQRRRSSSLRLEAAPTRDYAIGGVDDPSSRGERQPHVRQEHARPGEALRRADAAPRQRHGARHPTDVQARSARRAAEAGYKRESPRRGREDRPRRVRRRARQREDRGRRRLRRRLGHGGRSRVSCSSSSAARPALLRSTCRGSIRLALALSGKSFVPSAQAEAFLSNQIDAVRSQRTSRPEDPRARERLCGRDQRLLPVEGDPSDAVHRERRRRVRGAHRRAVRHERRAGGRRTRCSSTRSRERLGDADARRVFADLREANDPECAGQRARVVPATDVRRRPRAGKRRARRRQLHGRAARGAGLRRRTRCSSARSARRRGTRCSSPARRSGTSSRSSSRRWSSPAPASTCAEPCSRACRSSSSDVARLRVERDVVAGRQPRPLRRDALRRRPHYLYRGQCEPMRRFFVGHAQGAGPARPGGLVRRDDARPGRRLRDGRRASASRSRCSARPVVASFSRRRRSTT